ncbi:hypothetical protein [Aquisphaera insulae]|uniref:hypothetical protein n=1 Tax=Aquisphaera insulae TaxID=2712864 RepID=UPI0013EA7F28|nr:hypothetical protein [Aquisphaera insulae]
MSRAAGSETPFEDRGASALRALRGHLDLDEVEAALGVYRQSRERIRGWQPPPREWLDLIKGLLGVEAWDSAIAVMEDYDAGTEAPSPRVRLKLGQLLLNVQGRPAHALRVLDRIAADELPGPLEALRRQLRSRAEVLREEGPPELDAS